MFKFLGASAIMGTLLDIAGVAGLIIFGTFLVVIVVDLILSATSDREGLFFNKKKKQEAQHDEDIVYTNEPAPVEELPQQAYEQEPVEEDGIVFYNRPYSEEEAIAEQESLESKLEEQQPVQDTYYAEEEEVEEDIEAIALEVANKAVKELEAEALEKEKKVFKIKESEPVEEVVPIPPVEEVEEEEINDQQLEEIVNNVVITASPEPIEQPEEQVIEETVVEEPVIIEENTTNTDEEIKRLEEQRQELEKQVAVLHAERERDKQEILKTLQELRDKEPVVVETPDTNKEEEEKRRLANITRMNSRLSRIKSSTKIIEDKAKEEKVSKVTKQVVTVETEEVAPVEQAQVVEVHEKPRFKKSYYENRLEVLQQELKEVEAELKLNKKDFGPLEKVWKTFARDDAKLRRQEAIVAKQQVSVHGVNKKGKVNDKKKAKLEENVKQLKQLKESVYQCKLVIDQNKDRYPILEKNNKLLKKQISRLTEDIVSVNEALKWYEENNE